MNLSELNPHTLLGRRDGQPDPARAWSALLSAGALAFVVLLIWSVWAFSVVAGGGVLDGAATSTPPAVNQTLLKTVDVLFSDRAAENAKYQDGTYRFSDPSQ